MACIGNKCPGGVNPNGGSNADQPFETNFCIDHCVSQCVPASVLVHIQSKLQRDKHRGFYISVTSLLGCLRQLYLERTIDYFVEPYRNWYMLRGSILHHLLERPGLETMVEDIVKEVLKRADEIGNSLDEVKAALDEAMLGLDKLVGLLPSKDIPNWQAETEYEYETGLYVDNDGNITFSSHSPSGEPYTSIYLRGTIDVLRPDSGELYDYKTIGDRGLNIIKNGPKPDHIMQFNLYRLLVEKGRPVGSKHYKPITITKITAFYMTMMQVVRTGGLLEETTPWRISDPPNHPSMVGDPQLIASQFETKLKRGKDKGSNNIEDYSLVENKRFKLMYQIPDVPMLDLDECAKFITDTVPLLYNGFYNNQMPPMCKPEDRLWRCESYCPDAIREACDTHNLTTGEQRVVKVADTEIPVEGV